VGELPAVLRPLAADPGHSGLCLDFDGTLSPIVADPETAFPLPGVTEVLARLAGRFALVAIISGRPVAFLRQVLGPPTGVRLVGLYGLEQIGPDGARTVDPAAQPWAAVIAEVVPVAQREAPPGVHVEPKGLTVTLHWRHAPEASEWVEAFAARQVAERGLRAHGSRLSVELGPPLDIDKGTVVRSLTPGLRAVAAFGDDVGDLPAFAALGELAAAGVAVARVAVVDAESPPEVATGADLLVEGAPGALALLEQLARVAG
jgi:trehalose 6-phosphate phosphatase